MSDRFVVDFRTSRVGFARDPRGVMVAIHGPAVPAFPDSIVCAGWRAVVGDSGSILELDGDTLRSSLGTGVARRMTVPAVSVAPGAAARFADVGRGSLLSEEARRAMAHSLATGQDLDRHLRSLSGLGPGLTPSGDDLMLGICAGLDLEGDGEARRRFRLAFEEVVASAPAATTPVAAALLRAALEGRHIPALVELCAAAADPSRSIGGEVARVRAIGATTGSDLLEGLAIAAAGLARGRRAA